MSVNYATALSQCEDKGVLGRREKFDSEAELRAKCQELANLIKSSECTVVHTGAGISTSCGIPDFRGPKGVWTLEAKGKKPEYALSFTDARPSYTHRFLVELEKRGMIQFLVSQNVDGLHMRSGFPRSKMAEVHGNMFIQKCSKCKRDLVCDEPPPTLGLKPTGKFCKNRVRGGDECKGPLHDTVLDWDQALPQYKFKLAKKIGQASKLCIGMGTSFQIAPVMYLPQETQLNEGKIVIINLQKTECDGICDIKINGYVDEVSKIVAGFLGFKVPQDDGENQVVERSSHPMPIDINSRMRDGLPWSEKYKLWLQMRKRKMEEDIGHQQPENKRKRIKERSMKQEPEDHKPVKKS